MFFNEHVAPCVTPKCCFLHWVLEFLVSPLAFNVTPVDVSFPT